MGLHLDGIGKRYGDVWALDQIDLEIPTGSFFSLLGGSGSGKTTILKIVAGIEGATRGQLSFEGRDVASTPMESRPFNTVFQGYALFPHMTAFQNVAFGLKVKGLGAAEIKRRVGEMLDRVGLSDRAQAYPAQLSGGQQQRVAIARVLVCEPKVILLDEPLSALDASLRGQMQRFLKDLHRDLGLTFVFVTHDQDEAMSLSDQICVLNEGRIEQIGTPDALYHAPATAYVAGFIGLNNLFPSGDGEFGTLPGNGLVAVRPETININGGESFGAQATLIDRRFHGDNTLMTFRTGAGQEVSVRRPGRGESIGMGETAHISFAPESCAMVGQ